jgi:hypothetical protein
MAIFRDRRREEAEGKEEARQRGLERSLKAMKFDKNVIKSLYQMSANRRFATLKIGDF